MTKEEIKYSGLVISGTKRGKQVFFTWNIEEETSVVNDWLIDARTPVQLQTGNLSVNDIKNMRAYASIVASKQNIIISLFRAIYDAVGRPGYFAVSLVVPQGMMFSDNKKIFPVLKEMSDLYFKKYVDNPENKEAGKIMPVTEDVFLFSTILREKLGGLVKGDYKLASAKAGNNFQYEFKSMDELAEIGEFFYRPEIAEAEQVYFLPYPSVFKTSFPDLILPKYVKKEDASSTEKSESDKQKEEITIKVPDGQDADAEKKKIVKTEYKLRVVLKDKESREVIQPEILYINNEQHVDINLPYVFSDKPEEPIMIIAQAKGYNDIQENINPTDLVPNHEYRKEILLSKTKENSETKNVDFFTEYKKTLFFAGAFVLISVIALACFIYKEKIISAFNSGEKPQDKTLNDKQKQQEALGKRIESFTAILRTAPIFNFKDYKAVKDSFTVIKETCKSTGYNCDSVFKHTKKIAEEKAKTQLEAFLKDTDFDYNKASEFLSLKQDMAFGTNLDISTFADVCFHVKFAAHLIMEGKKDITITYYNGKSETRTPEKILGNIKAVLTGGESNKYGFLNEAQKEELGLYRDVLIAVVNSNLTEPGIEKIKRFVSNNRISNDGERKTQLTEFLENRASKYYQK